MFYVRSNFIGYFEENKEVFEGFFWYMQLQSYSFFFFWWFLSCLYNRVLALKSDCQLLIKKYTLRETVDDENSSVLGIELIQFRQSLRTCVCRKFLCFLVSEASVAYSWLALPLRCCISAGWQRWGERGLGTHWRRGPRVLEVRVSLRRVWKKAFMSCFGKQCSLEQRGGCHRHWA